MDEKLFQIDLNTLVFNIIGQNNYSHCRLCLKKIQEQYVQFNDCITGDKEDAIYFQPLSELLSSGLGLQIEVSEDIPGVNAVCTECVDKTIESVRFLNQCHRSTELLNNVIHNLSNSLDINIESMNENQKLYISVGEFDSLVILEDKSTVMKKEPHFDKAKQLNCSDCKEPLKTIKLEDHISYLACDKCFATAPSEEGLDTHGDQKHKHKCSECIQFRTSKAAIRQHYDKAHSIYMCKGCGKPCKGIERLIAHEHTHEKANVHRCPKCGKKYLTQDFFLKHVHLCTNGLLDQHPSRSDLKRSFSCELCGKCYSTSGGLRVHMRFEHGDAKYHVCENCNKKFTAPSYLKAHMVKHTGEKNFHCNICTNKFVSKEALLYHIRRHTGERPYTCKFCEEKFVNASARAEHIKFKHVEPSYECKWCSRKFVTSFFLKKHMERHHDPRSKLYLMRFNVPPVSLDKRMEGNS